MIYEIGFKSGHVIRIDIDGPGLFEVLRNEMEPMTQTTWFLGNNMFINISDISYFVPSSSLRSLAI